MIASPNCRDSLQWAAQKRYYAGERDEKVEIRRIDVHGLSPAQAPIFEDLRQPRPPTFPGYSPPADSVGAAQ
jgi:hypothetical protein